jgi:peptidoglycan/LPS O-acetylase OafA/YrhL
MSSLIKSSYRPDIDGLRAIAILSVVAFHAFPQWCKSGFIGVDMFFVISGYLISGIILANLAKGSFSFIEFYCRRIRRIFPALTLILASSFLIGWFAFYPEEMVKLSKHIFSGAGFFSNFLLLEESGYFNSAAITKTLMHLWSLGVEEQFYILWPPLLVLIWKEKAHWALIMSLLIILSFIYNILMVYPKPIVAFYSPLSRFWELWVGAALAWIFLHNQKLPHKLISNGLSVVGLILLCLGFWSIDKDSIFPNFLVLFPVLGTALLIAGGERSYINQLLAQPVLVLIGLISFPLYLWHWLLISSAEIISDYSGDMHLRYFVVSLSFVLAWLTYKFIETPIRNGFGGRTLVGWLLVINIAIGCLAIVSYFHFQDVIKQKGTNLAEIPVPPIEGDKHATIILIGDSHAKHLQFGLKRVFGENVKNFSENLCLPLENISVYNKLFPDVDRCLAISRRAMGFLQHDENVDTVVMSNMGPTYLTGSVFRVKHDELEEGLEVKDIANKQLIDRWEIYELALRDTLKKIISYHKKVVFVLDIPEISASPADCKQGRFFNIFGYSFYTRKSSIENCAVTRQDFEIRISRYRELVHKVLKDFPEVVLFDPTNLFCDEQFCYWNKNGSSLYRDANHLSEYGSAYVAQYLAPVIFESIRWLIASCRVVSLSLPTCRDGIG